MGMKEKELDVMKKEVHALIDRVLSRTLKPEEGNRGSIEMSLHTTAKKHEIQASKEEKEASKRRKENLVKKRKPRTSSDPQENASQGKSARVEKIKRILKQATITISPSIYVKHKAENELYEALCNLLRKEGLSSNPSEREISALRKRKQIERDLDGIDTSNIIETGRRRRTTTGTRFSYQETVGSDEDDEGVSHDSFDQDDESELETNDPSQEAEKCSVEIKKDATIGNKSNEEEWKRRDEQCAPRRRVVLSDDEE